MLIDESLAKSDARQLSVTMTSVFSRSNERHVLCNHGCRRPNVKCSKNPGSSNKALQWADLTTCQTNAGPAFVWKQAAGILILSRLSIEYLGFSMSKSFFLPLCLCLRICCLFLFLFFLFHAIFMFLVIFLFLAIFLIIVLFLFLVFFFLLSFSCLLLCFFFLFFFSPSFSCCSSSSFSFFFLTSYFFLLPSSSRSSVSLPTTLSSSS